MHPDYLIILLTVVFLAACTNTGDKSSEKPGLDLGNRHKIAYNVLYDEETDNYEVFVMNTDGSDQKNISNWEGVDWVYHAYRDKIYFVSDRDTTHRVFFLYEMNVDGENIKKVADFQVADSWLSSRNGGSELIVKPHPKLDTAFYIINLQNQQRRAIKPDLAYFHDPCFSPDGKQIVFRGATERIKGVQGFKDELFIMDANGSGLRQLTHYPQNDTSAEWFDYRAGPPVWYRDDKISFASKQNGSYSIFSIDADGANLQQLTSHENSQVYHSWLPGGTSMVFEQSSNEYENYDIYILDIETKEVKQLTDDRVAQQAPVFAEVGQKERKR